MLDLDKLTKKEKMLIALSSYATHKPYSFTEWIKIKEEVKEDIDLMHRSDNSRIRTA